MRLPIPFGWHDRGISKEWINLTEIWLANDSNKYYKNVNPHLPAQFFHTFLNQRPLSISLFKFRREIFTMTNRLPQGHIYDYQWISHWFGLSMKLQILLKWVQGKRAFFWMESLITLCCIHTAKQMGAIWIFACSVDKNQPQRQPHCS